VSQRTLFATEDYFAGCNSSSRDGEIKVMLIHEFNKQLLISRLNSVGPTSHQHWLVEAVRTFLLLYADFLTQFL
jgi:hypothetical protein